MIGRLSGILLQKLPLQVVIDCGGVGYEVSVPMSTFYNLPAEGQKVTLLTHLIVREDAHILFGFEKSTERTAFRELIKVSGIGARMALAILSGMSIADLSTAVATQDAARLVKVPGIGKKTADRLLLELRGKFAVDLSQDTAGPASDHNEDVVAALISLGYSDKEARLATKQLPADVSPSDGIRLALKSLYRDKT